MQMYIYKFERAKPCIFGRLLKITHRRNLWQGYEFILNPIMLFRKSYKLQKSLRFGVSIWEMEPCWQMQWCPKTPCRNPRV